MFQRGSKRGVLATTVVFLIGLASSGCAGTVRAASAGAAEAAVPAATQSALETLEDPKTRERMAALVRTPEMQGALQEVSAGVSRGVIDGLTDAQMEQLVTALTRAAVRAAASELAHAGESVGPAMRKAMVEEIGPGMTEMIKSPAFKVAMAEMAHDIARASVVGSSAGVAELARKEKQDEGSTVLGTIGAALAKSTWLLATIVTAVVFALPLIWLLRERTVARRAREAAEQRSARAAVLLGALDASADNGWSRAVLDLLKHELSDETKARASERPPDADERVPASSRRGRSRERPA